MWDKIIRRLKLILSVGSVVGSDQTSQTVDFSDSETSKNIQFAQCYGIEVYPLPGSKAVTVFNAGDRSQGISIGCVDRRHTHTLEPGDVMLYDNRNQFVHLKNSGIDIKVVGNLNINATGNIAITSQTLSHNGINVGDTHNHPQNSGDHFGGGTNTSAPNAL
ncbi:phage baseplate assembly protein domain-containing protein [Bathymodiolus septemdierum thioautotrophic gill symbiont]|uniref:Phage baseplate assembly protein n=1 Tax=endosymbiont of Bathymodiolus septemdierum str. Myojin knoll TaxID=1303921 RepID=A0A0P0URS9_9GAMM|nr:phage baseplate assembly protein [Bathymodiolus septemdierum thioautotrophic gill symbiont]BAS67614.1 phage baseplate assembly protein [endosymbiont of Bathymodiolus septemdierum str. Myojin knoll]